MHRVATTLTLLVVPVFALTAACGGAAPEPVAPTDPPASPSSGAPDEEGAAASPDGEAGAAPAPARPKRPLSVHSSCTDVVTLAFGDDPKDASAGKRTLSPSSSIDAPRDAAGNQTVWLLDEKGEPLIKVRITRGMTQVEVGRSCRTLDAH